MAQVAQAARPRYHFATAAEIYYQREPYMNTDRGVGSHATRFVSLGAVGNPAKAKWLHALALEPASRMSAADISAVPEHSTKSPYLFSVGQKRKVGLVLLVECQNLHGRLPSHAMISVALIRIYSHRVACFVASGGKCRVVLLV